MKTALNEHIKIHNTERNLVNCTPEYPEKTVANGRACDVWHLLFPRNFLKAFVFADHNPCFIFSISCSGGCFRMSQFSIVFCEHKAKPKSQCEWGQRCHARVVLRLTSVMTFVNLKTQGTLNRVVHDFLLSNILPILTTQMLHFVQLNQLDPQS